MDRAPVGHQAKPSERMKENGLLYLSRHDNSFHLSFAEQPDGLSKSCQRCVSKFIARVIQFLGSHARDAQTVNIVSGIPCSASKANGKFSGTGEKSKSHRRTLFQRHDICGRNARRSHKWQDIGV